MLKLDFENPIYETVWIGDDAVDEEATDIETWLTSGEGYVLRPKAKPSIIRYRGLTERELANVYQDAEGYFGNLVAEMVRYGVKNIEGVRLQKEKRGGISCLTDDALDSIAQVEAELPFKTHMRHLLSNIFGALEQRMADVEEQVKDMPETGKVSMLSFLAALVAARTFRRR